MNANLTRQIANSLETTPELLPFIPELLADFHVLGAMPDEILQLLTPLSLSAATRALDLGCGKGAVDFALVEQLGFHVVGVDAFRPFIEYAKHHARQRGLSDQCQFHCADLHDWLDPSEPFDVALMLAVGDVLGGLQGTVAALRTCVRPGGYFIPGVFRQGSRLRNLCRIRR